ncbi:MAG: alpha/beta hydrolase [Eubacterium sp.]
MDIFKPILKTVWYFTGKGDERRIASQTPPEDIACITDIPYINDLNKYHLLDIYYPENMTDKLPMIIDIHGGGWWYGTKEINKYYCMQLAKKGFVVANINYRLADKVTLIEQLEDIFACFKWIGENGEKYNADMNNVFLTGDSAGGQFCCLSAQINADASLRKKLFLPENSLNFRAAAATSPAIDLISPNFMMNVNLNALLGTVNHKESPYYFLLKFDNIASNALPPFYIVTSSGDFIRRQSHRLHEILDGLGVENRLRDFTQTYNGKKLPHVFSVVQPFIEPSLQVINELTGFFIKHIKD